MPQSIVLAALSAGLTIAVLSPGFASAQEAPPTSDNSTTFRGIRIEGNAGGEWFKSQGKSNSRFGYGGTVGFDGTYRTNFVIGAEGSYWRPDGRSQNCTNPTATSLRCDLEGREFGAAVRAGYLFTPSLLVFGKGGYVNAAQSGTYSTTTGFFAINGSVVGPGYSTYQRTHTDGYQLGGGVEYTLYRHIYVDAQYVYSRYDNHTRRQRVVGGVGVRF